MKFGQADHPQGIDFTLPVDHADTAKDLAAYKNEKAPFEVYVGCAQWNKTDLKGFYPRGTEDEVPYYSSQFNSIELNVAFHKSPGKRQVETWDSITLENYRVLPKTSQTVSHFKRLQDLKQPVEEFCDAISLSKEKPGMTFLEMPDNSQIMYLERVNEFVPHFSNFIRLAVEIMPLIGLPTNQWHLHKILLDNGASAVIMDTAGRRDMLPVGLTTETPLFGMYPPIHPAFMTVGRIGKKKSPNGVLWD